MNSFVLSNFVIAYTLVAVKTHDSSIPERTLNIGVLLWLNQTYGRDLFVAAEACTHTMPGVHIRVIPANRGTHQREYERIRLLDGLISALSHRETADRRPHIEVPIVECPPMSSFPDGITTVATDPSLIGTVAAQHLLSLQLSTLIVCSRQRTTNRAIREAFQRTAQEAAAGVQNVAIANTEDADEMLHAMRESRGFPAGVFCLDDRTAAMLVRQATRQGVRIPDELPILALGDDPFLCLAAMPQLSSLPFPIDAIARAATSALVDLVSGKPAESQAIPPLQVRQRESSNMLAGCSREIQAAVLYIRANAHESITVPDIARAAGVPRHALEYRFRRDLGRSVFQELVRCRIERAKQMLTDTAMPLKAIAHETGRMTPQNFNRFFRHHTGVTPTAWRREIARTVSPAGWPSPR